MFWFALKKALVYLLGYAIFLLAVAVLASVLTTVIVTSYHKAKQKNLMESINLLKDLTKDLPNIKDSKEVKDEHDG